MTGFQIFLCVLGGIILLFWIVLSIPVHVSFSYEDKLYLTVRYLFVKIGILPLQEKGCISLPVIPPHCTHNAHMFYLVLPSLEARTGLLAYLKEHEVYAVFHYLSLHSSPYYASRHDGRALPECDRYADCLVRLPLFYDLKIDDVERICDLIEAYYR